MEAANNLGRLAPVIPWIAGQIVQDAASGLAPTLAYQSGFALSDQSQVAYSRVSAGNYTLTVQNFLGLNGAVSGALGVLTTGTGLTAQYTATYSGATATITILTFNSSAVAADCSVGFEFKGI